MDTPDLDAVATRDVDRPDGGPRASAHLPCPDQGQGGTSVIYLGRRSSPIIAR
jgi:hypothetical protein